MIGKKLSHFRVLAKIGEGGMGVVYRAEDERLRRQVAFKVLPPELTGDEGRRLRFLREARAAAAVPHPSIAAIYEIGEAEGVFFIAMELVEGKTLRSLMGGRSLPVKEALRIATEMADGFARAHQAGIVHRDLKPDNVMVGPDGRVKILDFGLARLPEEAPQRGGSELSRLDTISGELTREGKVLGTAAYMSPEQARGLPVDARSDLFSFGTTLYEMVAARVPFTGRTTTDILMAIVRDDPAPPCRLNPEVPQEFERIILKCLEKEPGDRYQHTDDLLVDLRKLKRVTDSGVQAVSAAPGKPLRRRLSPAALGGLVLLVALVAAMGSYLILRRGSGRLPELTQKQLTANPPGTVVYDAAISPDGKYLAYSDSAGLHFQMIETGDTHRVALPAGFHVREVTWYPDSARLLVTGADASNPEFGLTPALWSISILGGAPRRLRADAWRASVSPDGTAIAFLNVKPGWPPREIWLMGPNGEQPRRIAAADKGHNLWWVGWSPDGSRVLYGRYHYAPSGSEMIIESRGPDGSDAAVAVSDERLFQSWHGILGACWLAGGRLIYARTEPPGDADSNLWEIRLDARSGRPLGDARRITNWPGYSVRRPSASADGRRLVLLRHRQQPDVYVGEFQAGTRRLKSSVRLTLDEREDYPDAWTADGRAVVFSSNRRGKQDIFKQEVGSVSAEALIVGPEEEWGADPTPDGASLLYWVRKAAEGADPQSLLMRAPIAGGPSEIVLSGREAAEIDGYACARSPRGGCVASRLEGTRLVFTSLDTRSGVGAELARIEVDPSAFYNWDLSPDGSRVALVNFANWVRVLTLSTGEVREISAGNWNRIEFVAWTADGRGMIVTGVDITLYHGLLYLGLDGRREIVWQKENEWPVVPVPSPDGRYLAYASMIAESNAWMIKGF